MRIDPVTSNLVVVKRRCPQGSRFGPLMWNIFQNDMSNITSDANVSIYADDHQVFEAKETTKRVETIPMENGKRMTEWYQGNFQMSNAIKIRLWEVQKLHCRYF